MSLKAFHIFFITASSLLAGSLAYWGFSDYHISGNQTNLVLGLVGIFIFVLLIPYFFWFRKKMSALKKMSLVLVVWFASALMTQPAWACAVCYGDPASPLTKGARYGVFFLITVVAGVLTTIASVGFSWARRAKKLAVG